MRLLTVALLCFGLFGCRSIQSTELVGTWTMRAESQRILPIELQKNSTKIILAADGTFIASDLPGIFDFPSQRARLGSGSGIWKIISSEGRQQVLLNFEPVPNGSVATKLTYGMPMDVSKGWSVVTLYYFLGDPDEGLSVEFEKDYRAFLRSGNSGSKACPVLASCSAQFASKRAREARAQLKE